MHEKLSSLIHIPTLLLSLRVIKIQVLLSFDDEFSGHLNKNLQEIYCVKLIFKPICLSIKLLCSLLVKSCKLYFFVYFFLFIQVVFLIPWMPLYIRISICI